MDSHFNAYKVKYDLLNNFIQPIRMSQIVRHINIFVNLDDLFHNLHRPLVNNEFQICGKDAPKQFISNVFNLLGHYRYWAIKNNFDCSIYGIFTSTMRSFKNNIYNPDYRKRFKEINSDTNAQYYFINEAVRASLPILSVISHYIPDVYIIDSKYLEPSIIPLYITSEVHHADWNILITRDSYDLQYAYRNKWTVVAPKGEYSTAVNQEGIWNYINFRENVFKDEVNLHYPYSLYILSKSVVGDVYRSIPRIRKIGWKTLFKYLDTVVSESSNSTNITLQLKLIELLKAKQITDKILNDNLNTINIDLQIENLIEIDKTSINIQLNDIPDYENLKELNRTQFSQYPLNLQFLCNQLVDTRKKTPFD
jgi:hypothetical protein